MTQYDSFDFDEKMSLFESIPIDKNPYIWNMAYDEDEEIRLFLSIELANYKSAESEQLLLQLISDQSDIVRANACDSIYWSESVDVLDTLFEKAKNDVYLVRGYAVLSIADISINSKSDFSTEKLSMLYPKEKSIWVRMCYFQSFYRLGNENYLTDLISSLDSKKYNYRIAAVNFLSDIVNESNKSIIMKSFEQRLNIEKNKAVIQLITQRIKEIG